jgi:hypothetical protein
MGPNYRDGLWPSEDKAPLKDKLAALVEGLDHATCVAGSLDCPTGDFTTAIEVIKLIPQLFDKIAHGEAGHREWLEEAIENHFTGKPMPEYRAK